MTMNLDLLALLWNITQQHPGTSGARAAAGVLLGLYNGERFPFDLTELRLLDGCNRTAALHVITVDACTCKMGIHLWLNRLTERQDFRQRFEHLAHEYGRRGRCKIGDLEKLTPHCLVIDTSRTEGV